MKKLLFIYLLFVPLLVQAKKSISFNTTVFENKLLKGLDSNWRFIAEDDTSMAAKDYNDSNWVVIQPALSSKSDRALLKGVCWFRKQVYVNDSILALSLSLNMTQYGASEVYIDGVLLESFGTIGDNEENTEYYNPVKEPYLFHFKDTGMHTIAVRCANYRSKIIAKDENYIHGFKLIVAEANMTHESMSLMSLLTFSVFFGLGCVFIALSWVHFLLWLFRRKDLSNLFLSILCGVVCVYFFMNCYWTQTTDTDVYVSSDNTSKGLFVIALIALSALLNDLFGAYKKRFIIIISVCVVAFVMIWGDMPYKKVAYSAAVVFVMIEAIVLVVSAWRKKIEGAGILGFSVLPMAVFSLVGFVMDLFSNDGGEEAGFSILLLMSSLMFGVFKMIAYSCIPISMSVFLAWRFAHINKNLGLRLQQVQDLSEKTHKQEEEKKRILENQKAKLEQEVTERTSEIIEEKKKSDDLLLNILPEEVARELKEKGTTTAHVYDKVTVLFTDFVDFTKAGERMGSEGLVAELHSCFKAFDEIMGKYGIEKIKTIGDAYLAVCGLPTADERHAEKVVQAAEDIRSFMKARRAELGDKTFEVRIGIHSGDVVAGIVGVKKFAFDIWGDTVNTAARMESNSEAGKINISQTTYELVHNKFDCTYRGEIEAKGKGMLKMYFVD